MNPLHYESYAVFKGKVGASAECRVPIIEYSKEQVMRVGLFVPCYVDAFHPQVGIATLELLERFGIEVEYPFDQTC